MNSGSVIADSSRNGTVTLGWQPRAVVIRVSDLSSFFAVYCNDSTNDITAFASIGNDSYEYLGSVITQLVVLDFCLSRFI